MQVVGGAVTEAGGPDVGADPLVDQVVDHVVVHPAGYVNVRHGQAAVTADDHGDGVIIIEAMIPAGSSRAGVVGREVVAGDASVVIAIVPADEEEVHSRSGVSGAPEVGVPTGTTALVGAHDVNGAHLGAGDVIVAHRKPLAAEEGRHVVKVRDVACAAGIMLQPQFPAIHAGHHHAALLAIVPTYPLLQQAQHVRCAGPHQATHPQFDVARLPGGAAAEVGVGIVGENVILVGGADGRVGRAVYTPTIGRWATTANIDPLVIGGVVVAVEGDGVVVTHDEQVVGPGDREGDRTTEGDVDVNIQCRIVVPILDQVINGIGGLVGRRAAVVVHVGVVPVAGPSIVSFHVVDHRGGGVAGRRPLRLGEEPAQQVGHAAVGVLVVQQLAVGDDEGAHILRREDADGAASRGVHAWHLDLSVDHHVLRRGVVGYLEAPHNLLVVEAEPQEAGPAQVGGDLVLAAAQVVVADVGERTAVGVPHPGVSG